MVTKGKEVCGYFTVETENHEIDQVVVTQDNLSHYRKEKNYCKQYKLSSLHGADVYTTNSPDIFQLADGSLLKRKRQ